jgi:trehalose/maltose transport system permease protein
MRMRRFLNLGMLLWAVNILLLLFFLFPFYWQTITAFKMPGELYTIPIKWFPSQLYWGNFHDALVDRGFLVNMRNSTVAAGSATLLTLVMGTLGAYALANLRIRGRRAILIVAITVVSLPSVAIVGALYIMLRDLALMNTLMALIIPYTALSTPFALWVLTSFLNEIPHEILEQGQVDGCTRFQSLIRLILPLAAPGITTVGLLVFINNWNEFLFALTFTTTSSAMTVPVAIYNFQGEHAIPWGDIAAGSEIATLPIVLLVLVFQRRIVQGLTAGAVKE